MAVGVDQWCVEPAKPNDGQVLRHFWRQYGQRIASSNMGLFRKRRTEMARNLRGVPQRTLQ